MHPFYDFVQAIKRFFRRPQCQTEMKRDLSELKVIANNTAQMVASSHGILKTLARDMQRDKKTQRKQRQKERGAA